MSDKGREIVLVGAGGHCRSVIDVIEQSGQYRVAGIVGMAEELGTRMLGYDVFATDADLPRLTKEYGLFHIAMGFLRSPQRRIELFDSLSAAGAMMPVIISPLAYVSPHASVGEGTIIMHGAIVNAAAIVGRNAIINSRALIEHDAVVEDHCHVATTAVINGGVRVGRGSFVGSGAVTKQGVVIPDMSFIKANTIVK